VYAEVFKVWPDESIDYVMVNPLSFTVNGYDASGTKSPASVVVVSLVASWSDLGSWSELWDIKPKDEQGNVLSGDVIAHDTHNSLVMSDDRLITTQGVDDLIILIPKMIFWWCIKIKLQNVKTIVTEIKASSHTKHFQHREVYSP
jgi:mannose-1-phosphate guanylyltransferase